MADSRNEDREPQSHSRFSLWTVLTGFSIVVLAEIASTTDDQIGDRSRKQKWAMAVACISLALGALAVVAHILVRDRFTGTPVEGGLIILCLGFWAAGLPSIINPKNQAPILSYSLTDDDGGEVTTTVKVYFFTWGSIVASLLLAGSFFREFAQAQFSYGIPKRSLWWCGLCVTSLIVMSTASRFFHLIGCTNDVVRIELNGYSYHEVDVSGFCKRVKFGVSLGVIGGVVALMMGIVSHLLPVVVESVVALVMMIGWCFGLGFLTFGSKAPATNAFNFFFSVWASFTIAAFLASDSGIDAYRKMRGEDNRSSSPSTETKPSKQPEDGDHDVQVDEDDNNNNNSSNPSATKRSQQPEV